MGEFLSNLFDFRKILKLFYFMRPMLFLGPRESRSQKLRLGTLVVPQKSKDNLEIHNYCVKQLLGKCVIANKILRK